MNGFGCVLGYKRGLVQSAFCKYSTSFGEVSQGLGGTRFNYRSEVQRSLQRKERKEEGREKGIAQRAILKVCLSP